MPEKNTNTAGEKKTLFQNISHFLQELLPMITACKSVGWVVLKCVLMVGIPYAYLYVCGIIDGALIRGGFAHREDFILFVLISLIIFWVIGIILAVMTIRRWMREQKSSETNTK